MTVRCVALSSGGLDSMLAIRIMQEQGIEVEALNFKTVFTCCQDEAGQTARNLGVRVTVIGQEDDYLDLVREPQFGYGKGANPCVDCRIYMFKKAKVFMEQAGARFIVSGEVVGQRPMSQKRRDLDIISYHSDCEDLLLRPLSAKRLLPTLPEREGWVDREKLYDFQGRSRKGLIALGKKLGLKDIPTPSTGCALTEPRFSLKVFDLLHQPQKAQRWDFELLKMGRHFRFDAHTKVVVGRNEPENDRLLYMHQSEDSTGSAILIPESFNGPSALIAGPITGAAIDYAAALVMRYSRGIDPHGATILVVLAGQERLIKAPARSDPVRAKTVATMD
jgi:tRNA U34 2-thiouridine synthase MnmA/TrmU